ncbi:hypothetical protein FH972_000493 [Carpinus fangiana]|uniref:S5 DRBM domain-containing protein n=1 Tax=Carpinus fangiana TaxID=176857 RepID=A0A5N6QBY7_9ROSI|nr:hypothetical protein FH972_000493 [Carpinus fangiana]
MATASATLSSLSSLSLHTTTTTHRLNFSKPTKPFFSNPTKLPLLHSFPSHRSTTFIAKTSDIDTTFFENFDPNEENDAVFNPPEPPEGFVAPPSFDDGPMETEEEIAAAYEELYGAAYSGESYLGNDIYVMDSKVRKTTGFGSKAKKEKVKDGLDERVVQVRRVTKVVKGGKQLHFRAIVVVGDKQGQVGVGVGKAKEVVTAVQKSAVNARRNIVSVPMTKYLTFPHRYFWLNFCPFVFGDVVMNVCKIELKLSRFAILVDVVIMLM